MMKVIHNFFGTIFNSIFQINQKSRYSYALIIDTLIVIDDFDEYIII